MLTRRVCLAAALLALVCLKDLPAQPATPPPMPPGPTAGAQQQGNITLEQQAILKDYEGFEKRLAELGEALRGSDLDRANLLLQARSESQRNQIHARMGEIAAILADQRSYADAVERQKAVVLQLEALLKILQTDAERDRLQARIKELEAVLKETNRVIAAQKDVRADTERGGAFDDLEQSEDRVAKAAGNLADRIDQQDAARRAEAGGEPGSDNRENPQGPNGSPMPGDSPMPGETPMPGGSPMPGENPMPGGSPMPGSPMPGAPMPGSPMPGAPMPGSPMPGAPMPGSPMPGAPMPGSPMPGEQPPSQGQPSQGQPSQGQPSQGQQQQQPGGEPQGPQPGSEQQPQDDRTPGRDELEQAREQMERAIQELKAQKRNDASDAQDAAIARLEQMKAQIEEILRQLRQEEKELYLTMLEARFQEMLRLQLRINADTVRLDSRSTSQRGEAHFTKSRDLSQQEQQNVLAAEKALTLLKEEGSSVAFPEAVEQMKSNMSAVTTRLGKGDTGETTQLIEKLIVESLEEMVLSLQQELEKLKQQQQQDQQQQQQSGDQPLVDALAELKMVRSLQNQVNRLTRQVGQEVEGEQARDPDTLQLLQDLARRQQRIQEATYDLATKRNQ